MGRRQKPLYVARLAAFALAYAAVAVLCLRFDAVSGFATLVWPATGMSLAAIMFLGSEFLPAVLLGALVANLVAGATPWMAIGIALGNTLEAFAGAYALRRFVGMRHQIEKLSDALGFIVLAAGASTLLSAIMGVGTLYAGGVVHSGALGKTFSAWWLGDMLGNLVVGALLLTWLPFGKPVRSKRRLFEIAALAVSLAFSTFFVFFTVRGDSQASAFLKAYVFFPLIIWAALRFGLRGATATTFVLASTAIFGTVNGYGPFVRDTLSASLLPLQIFMAILGVTALVLSAAVSDRARAIRSRDEFLAVVSHDLLNPLHTIDLSAQSLASHSKADLSENAKKRLGVIRNSVERMQWLLRDLLDSAALDAGSLILATEHQDAASIIDEAVSLMTELAAKDGHTFRVDVPNGGIRVACDRRRILQVFSNLLGNAIKFTPSTGTITLSAHSEEARVRFTVTDTGPGIAPDDVARIFDRFTRGKGAHASGAGLGLAIVKGIVEAHGGKIWVTSRVGKGTTFCFTLPCAPQDLTPNSVVESETRTASPLAREQALSKVSPR